MKLGWFCFAPGTSKFGLNGVSDILAIKGGKFVALEGKNIAFTTDRKTKLKTRIEPKGTSLQEEFGRNVSAAGGWYRAFDQQTVESGELARWLVELDNLKTIM